MIHSISQICLLRKDARTDSGNQGILSSDNVLHPRKNELLRKYLFILIAVLLAAWVMVANVMIHPARFETNDDPAIAGIAYGVNGQYDSHLIFINIIWGRVLTALLSVYPDVAWYPVMECFVISVSFAALFYVFFQRFGIKNAWLPVFFLAFYFGAQYFTILQFSRTAGIACVAGMMLLLYSSESSGRWGAALTGLLICTVGSLYRFEVFEMLLVPFLGAGVYQAFSFLEKKDLLAVFRLMFGFACTLLLCTGLYLYDDYCYQNDPNWCNFREFNYLRSELLDRGFPDYEQNRELYDSLDISENDLALFKNWDFDDPEIFNTEALRRLVEAKEEFKVEKVDRKFQELLSKVFEYSFMQCIIAAAVLCLIDGKKGSVLLLFYELLAVFGVEYYFLLIGRLGTNTINLVTRMDVSVLLSAAVIVFYFGYSSQKVNLRKTTAVLLAVAIVLSGVFYNQVGLSSSPVTNKELIEREKEAYSDMHDDIDRLYAYATLAFYDVGLIWENRPLASRSNSMSLGGWKTRTYTRQYVMDSYGISNPFRDVVDNPSMYLVSVPGGAVDGHLAYIRNHYEPEAQAYLVRQMAGGYGVYRILSQKPIPDINRLITDSPRLKYGIKSYYVKPSGERSIIGELYVEGENTFDTTLYMSITAGDTTEFYVIPQIRDEDDNLDCEEGKYRFFGATLYYWDEGYQIRFYVDAPSGLYSAEMDPNLQPEPIS